MIPKTLGRMRRRNGVAGQYSYSLTVTYHMPDFHAGRTVDDVTHVAFVGSEHGAPVVMVTDSGAQTPVDNWRQYGPKLNRAWIRSFYGVEPCR